LRGYGCTLTSSTTKDTKVSDDFAEYRSAGIPSLMLGLGSANPQEFAEAKKNGKELPSNHSPYFAPDREPSLKTGIEVEWRRFWN
jgi:hypothetical protein